MNTTQSTSLDDAQVSAVIPTYNGCSLLEKHLPSVLATLRPGDELVIADDASSDNTIEWLRDRFKLAVIDTGEFGTLYEGRTKDIAVTLIAHHDTHRFAANCNSGVSFANGDFIFLLNNDVAPTEDALSHLLPYFTDVDVFAVGCLEYESEEHLETAGKNKLWFERGRFIHSKADDFKSGATAWVSGGSGLFDHSKWQALHGFDENFSPAYWEDIDLSYRAREMGWKTLFEKDAVVYHRHETTNTSVIGKRKMNKVSWRNGTYFTWKHANWFQRIQSVLWAPYWWWQRKMLP